MAACYKLMLLCQLTVSVVFGADTQGEFRCPRPCEERSYPGPTCDTYMTCSADCSATTKSCGETDHFSFEQQSCTADFDAGCERENGSCIAENGNIVQVISCYEELSIDITTIKTAVIPGQVCNARMAKNFAPSVNLIQEARDECNRHDTCAFHVDSGNVPGITRTNLGFILVNYKCIYLPPAIVTTTQSLTTETVTMTSPSSSSTSSSSSSSSSSSDVFTSAATVTPSYDETESPITKSPVFWGALGGVVFLFIVIIVIVVIICMRRRSSKRLEESSAVNSRSGARLTSDLEYEELSYSAPPNNDDPSVKPKQPVSPVIYSEVKKSHDSDHIVVENDLYGGGLAEPATEYTRPESTTIVENTLYA